MPNKYPEPQNVVLTILRADTSLVPVPFLDVINRWSTQGTPEVPSQTDYVWGKITDADYGRMRSVVVVQDGGEASGVGRAAPAIGARLAQVNVRGIAPANDQGKAALDLLAERMFLLFRRGRSFGMNDGGAFFPVTTDRQPLAEGVDFGYPGMVIASWRVLGEFVRRYAAA